MCSPLRRGWSRRRQRSARPARVLPAQAGVVLRALGVLDTKHSAPRSGGGGPGTDLVTNGSFTCSPLRRGWSLPEGGCPKGTRVLPAQAGVVPGQPRPQRSPEVLPAQAGVVPRRAAAAACRCGAPRSGGGGPHSLPSLLPEALCSPLRRGWSPAAGPVDGRRRVLPAQAGVVPLPLSRSGVRVRAPRSGGGGPSPP